MLDANEAKQLYDKNIEITYKDKYFNENMNRIQDQIIEACNMNERIVKIDYTEDSKRLVNAIVFALMAHGYSVSLNIDDNSFNIAW